MKRFEVLKPNCYNGFSCKGADCRYTCCQGWNIIMDREEYKALKKKSKDTENFISLMENKKPNALPCYKIDLQQDGTCPYLTDHGLCSAQAEHGENLLPYTCRIYPRVYHKYLNKFEIGLSLGCERVLELLYKEKDGLLFTNKLENIPNKLIYSSNITEKLRLKHPALSYYYDIQSLCIGILQAKDAEMEDRLILLAMALFHIDELSCAGNGKEIPSYITQYINSMESIDAFAQLRDIKGEQPLTLFYHLINSQRFISGDEHHYADFIKRVGEKLKMKAAQINFSEESQQIEQIYECSINDYQLYKPRYKSLMQGKEYFLENIMVGFMFFSNAPFHNPENGIWADYIYFAWVYAMIKFVLTLMIDETSTTEDLIDYCAIMFRKLGHNKALYHHIVQDFTENSSNSVAHLAVLLKSC